MKNKWFTATAYKTSETPLHVHDTMFKEGETYFVQKMDEDFTTVEGYFLNSLGGGSYKTQSILNTICDKYLNILSVGKENLMTVVSHDCVTDNSSWLSSIESASLTVKTQTGRRIWIRKMDMGAFTLRERRLVWKCVGDERMSNTKYILQLTQLEIKVLLGLEKRK